MQLKWDSGYAVNYNIHFLAEEKMFLSIGHSIQLSQKPKCIVFPPPCLTLGMVLFGSYLAFLVLQRLLEQGGLAGTVSFNPLA